MADDAAFLYQGQVVGGVMLGNEANERKDVTE